MFIKYIKELSVKKVLKNKLHNVKPSVLSTSIKTVGILVDESYFQEKEKLVRELIGKGISSEKISILAYQNKIDKNDTSKNPVFSNKDMNWKGEFSSESVNKFIQDPYDLLISYYDIEKAPLMLITHHSKALFKVGFSNIDKRLNHLMINTNAENYKVFIEELFKYLKILNKI